MVDKYTNPMGMAPLKNHLRRIALLQKKCFLREEVRNSVIQLILHQAGINTMRTQDIHKKT